MSTSKHLRGARIDPERIRPGMTVDGLIDGTFSSYNAGRLREACRLLTEKMLDDDVTIGISLTGALTPAGLGVSALIPLVEAGFVDWVISTGANLYHDAHFGLGLAMHHGNPFVSDVVLREEEVVRIYDIFFAYSVLLDTDAFFRQIIQGEEFQRTMSSAEFHHLCGRYVAERERKLGQTGESRKSLLAACHDYDVPVYTSSPGDSSIGMNVAAMALQGSDLRIDSSADVNETAAIVLDAKRGGGKSAVLILGGGSPKNFLLQTEPQIQEVLGIEEKGHDYFLQVTDARPDTGGLSGATPAEAVSWGKVDPDRLPDAVVCYTDATIALPLLTAYALERHAPREPKRLFRRREELLGRLRSEYEAVLAGGEGASDVARHGPDHQPMLDRDR
ncbi:MAG TPA: deoxyhypusine synthase [Longimicrobiales bacterium]|nr:deoxyhypusine synthase [Longimicrobiales bacterium]